MKILLLLLILPILSYGQKTEDSKIIIKVSDTTDIVKKVRVALSKNDFAIREDSSPDLIITHLVEMKTIVAYCRLMATIQGDTVILTGQYGSKKAVNIGSAAAPKNYKKILYFRGSKSWRLMQHVADDIGGAFEYGK